MSAQSHVNECGPSVFTYICAFINKPSIHSQLLRQSSPTQSAARPSRAMQKGTLHISKVTQNGVLLSIPFK